MALLNYICYRLLFDAFRLVDVLEGIYLLCLLMLDHPDLMQGVRCRVRSVTTAYLSESALTNCAVEFEMKEIDFRIKINWLRRTASHGSRERKER